MSIGCSGGGCGASKEYICEHIEKLDFETQLHLRLWGFTHTAERLGLWELS